MDITFEDPPERPQKSALEKLQAQLERQRAPFYELQKMYDLLHRSSPQYQMKGLQQQLELSRQIRDSLEHSSISKQVQEALAYTSIASQAQKLIDHHFPKNAFGISDKTISRITGTDAISKAAKQYEQYLKPISQQRELLEKLQRQAFGGSLFEDLARQAERTTPALSAIASAKKSLDDLWGQFRDIDLSQYEPDEEEEHEVQRVALTITQDAAEQRSLQDAVEQIVAIIKAQQKPSVQLMLWLFFRKLIEILIAGAVGAAMGHYASMVLGESPRTAKKALQQTARAAVGSPEFLVEYRYVSARLLIVRQNPKARSPEVGRLTLGKAVKLVRKDKDFALVVWTDKESEVEIQGWVFARYLGKFD